MSPNTNCFHDERCAVKPSPTPKETYVIAQGWCLLDSPITFVAFHGAIWEAAHKNCFNPRTTYLFFFCVFPVRVLFMCVFATFRCPRSPNMTWLARMKRRRPRYTRSELQCPALPSLLLLRNMFWRIYITLWRRPPYGMQRRTTNRHQPRWTVNRYAIAFSNTPTAIWPPPGRRPCMFTPISNQLHWT